MPDVSSHLIDCIGDFLEVAVHQVLHSKQIYAPELFERAKYFGFSAKRSRHPALNKYISSTIGRLKPLITNRSLQEFCILFSDPQGSPAERVTFIFALEDTRGHAFVDIAALQASFSSILLACTCSIPLVKPLPKGSTFELVVYSSSRDQVDFNFFAEDSTRSSELSSSTSQQGISAHAIKQIKVPNCLRAQVLLEQR